MLDYIIASCIRAGDTAAAAAVLRSAAKYSADLAVLDQIAFLQSEIKDYRACVETLRACLLAASTPEQQFSIRANAAKMYNHLNDPLVSLTFSNMNAAVKPDLDTQMEIAFSHYLAGNSAESERIMRKLAALQDLPDSVRGRVEYNIGSYDIEAGNFKRGLRGFVEVGHKIGIWPIRELPNIQTWDGSNPAGKTIIVHAEGGIGDEVINVRFMRNLIALGAKPIWVTGNTQLHAVFNRCGYTTVNLVNEIPATVLDNAIQCSAMSLPILLDLDADQLWNGPYLTPSAEYIEKWRNLLPTGLKLAVKWSGNPTYDQDLHRSIPLAEINKINFAGTKINLQLEPELDQTNMWPAREHIHSIEDTLALIWLCDNLVTSCTSIAHLCGALGKAGIVCPPIAAYYVWLGTRDQQRSNWYDTSLRVVRQHRHRDWTHVSKLLDN